MAFDSHEGRGVLFGGVVSRGFASDTFEWNGFHWRRTDADPRPGGRAYHAMSFDSLRNSTVLFGGTPPRSDETWERTGTLWALRSEPGPLPREAHAMAFDSNRGVTVLFGGRNRDRVPFGDTWEWNGAEWMLRDVPGPSARDFHAMAYDARRGVSVLFGGDAPSQILADTWEWDGNAWTYRGNAGPPRRAGHGMAFDSRRGTVVMFGGFGGDSYQFLNDTWEWDGVTWTEIEADPPPGRMGPMVYDTARDELVIFGGEGVFGRNWSNDTWGLSRSCVVPTIAVQPEPRGVCPGGAATFSVDAAGTAPFTYQWRRDGVALADEPNRISGAATPTLTLVNTTESDAGHYACVVANPCDRVVSAAATLRVCDLAADLDCNAAVSLADLAILLSNFGRMDSPARADGNLNGDETVDLADLELLLTEFGESCR